MPYRVLMLVYRKPTISPEQFEKHYEEVHIPLVHKIVGSVFPMKHVRRYIGRKQEPTEDISKYEAQILTGAQGDFPFDAIVEMSFLDQDAFKECGELLSLPTVSKEIQKDCELFMDTSKAPAVILSKVVKTHT